MPDDAGPGCITLHPGPVSTSVPSRKARPLWFRIHTWAGLKLSLVLLFILGTGTLATISHEIDWLLNAEMRANPSAASLGLGAQYLAARDAYPDWQLLRVMAPKAPWWATEISGLTPDGERRRIWIDPGTAHVNGDTGFVNVQMFLRRTHRHLMMPLFIGVPLVSSLAFVLLASLVSALFVYKRWWRGFFRPPRRRSVRTLWGDLHRLGGVWSLWFIVVMIVTGAFYFAESLGFRGDVPPPARAPITSLPSQIEPNMIEAGIALAQTEIENFSLRHIVLPRTSGDPIVLEGDGISVLVRPRANRISLDPSHGTILSVHTADTLSVWQRVSEAADPLHFGTFGGLFTKLLYFCFGVILTGLAGSGVFLYGKRAMKEPA